MLDIEITVFIIILLGYKKIKQGDSHKEILYWFGQTTSLHPVPNKLVEIYSHEYSLMQAPPSLQPSSFF